MKTSQKPQTWMPHISLLGCGFAAAALAAATLAPAQTAPTLRDQFLHPSPAARPMVRWWWFGAAVTKPEILNELKQMKADGIGGAELAFVYPEILDNSAKGVKNLPFLSKEMLEAVTYAQAQGRALGLRIDVTLCSGWPYGGPDTTLQDAATRLRIVEITLPAGQNEPPMPKLLDGESILSKAIVPGEPKHWHAGPADPNAPRTALIFIQSHTKQAVKRAAVGAEGFVLDPFSKQAVATHLAKVGEPLVKAFGATPPYAIFSDSLEAYGADWTPNLPAEFLKRRGYDLMPHLPELAAGGTPEAEKIRHDYGRTLTELVDENYLTQINDWAKAHHTKFRSQTYGEPAVSLASQRLVALPEGEGPQWRAFSTLRWATSANHLFGNNVTSGETFTWLHSPVFRATPLDMKAEADIDFIMGENQLIFHGWPYSPPASELPPGDPGWSLYAAAVFNDHNPWHPVMPAVNQYITRVSALLRQGQPANQVAILLPTDDAWASFVPGKVSVTEAMKKLLPADLIPTILSAGYNFDFTDADTINRLGIHHPILVIPPTTRIPIATLDKIEAYATSGGKVISVGPIPKLDPEGDPIPNAKERSKAIPVIPDAGQLNQALHNAATPDLALADADSSTRAVIGFIRRKLPGADVYFVANTSNHPVQAKAAFGSSFVNGYEMSLDTGASEPAPRHHAAVSLNLAPYQSAVYVFNNDRLPWSAHGDDQTVADLTSDWQVTFVATGKSQSESTLTDWLADPSTKNYSGEAIYSREFTLTKTDPVYLEVEGGAPIAGAPTPPAEHEVIHPGDIPNPNPTNTRPGPGMRAFYDPPIKEAALVVINGQPAGALWHPPYRLDVTKFLKPGQNKIEIHVYNTAINAWAAIPPHDYKPLVEKYGDRFQMQDLQKVVPASSGLLGKIHLVTTE